MPVLANELLSARDNRLSITRPGCAATSQLLRSAVLNFPLQAAPPGWSGVCGGAKLVKQRLAASAAGLQKQNNDRTDRSGRSAGGRTTRHVCRRSGCGNGAGLWRLAR